LKTSGAEEAAEKRLFCALRFLSKGFALALGSRGTALTKSSPGYAQACGTVENTFEAPIRRRPLRDCDHSWQRQRWKRWAIIRRPCRGWVEI